MYKLSKVGQAIENNDLSAAISVLGQNTDADWVKKANLAFSKVLELIVVFGYIFLSLFYRYVWILDSQRNLQRDRKWKELLSSFFSL